MQEWTAITGLFLLVGGLGVVLGFLIFGRRDKW